MLDELQEDLLFSLCSSHLLDIVRIIDSAFFFELVLIRASLFTEDSGILFRRVLVKNSIN